VSPLDFSLLEGVIYIMAGLSSHFSRVEGRWEVVELKE